MTKVDPEKKEEPRKAFTRPRTVTLRAIEPGTIVDDNGEHVVVVRHNKLEEGGFQLGRAHDISVVSLRDGTLRFLPPYTPMKEIPNE